MGSKTAGATLQAESGFTTVAESQQSPMPK
jgi:hypothetical protein